MGDISEKLLESIQTTQRCMVDVSALACRLVDLTQQQIEASLLKFVNDGDDQAVSVVLHACAMNQLKLDPDVLCQCIGVCVEFPDSAPCFAFQDATVVPRLLDEAHSEALSIERQIYIAQLATELSINFDLDFQPVRKVLWKLKQIVFPLDQRLLVSDALFALDDDDNRNKLFRTGLVRWTQIKQSKLLPEHRPKSVVGGTYTVRRTMPKVGRNEPCHCGSGNKYKKCCLSKDQAFLSDASQYDGKTRTEIKQQPGLVDDPAIIQTMRAYELKKLNPDELGDNQLFAAFRRCSDFGLLALSFDMLLACDHRLDTEKFDRGHFEDLLMRAFELGDLELAKKIRHYCGEDYWTDAQSIQFHFDLFENPERYKALDADCALSVRGVLEDELVDEPLTRLAYDFSYHFPALSIAFARAAMVGQPDNEFENSMLLDLINDARVDLDMKPWGDPAEALLDKLDIQARQQTQREQKAQVESAEIKRLRGHLDATRADLDEKKQALLEMQRAVGDITQELEKAKKQPEQPSSEPLAPVTEPQTTAGGSEAERAETRQRLRARVERLKAEIGEQQKQRAQLRKQLVKESRKQSSTQGIEQQAIPQKEPELDQPSDGLVPTGRPCVPEYSDIFRKNCDALPAPIAAKAILFAGRFACLDKAIWQQTKPLKRLSEHYRIRIHRDYRMIVRRRTDRPHLILDVIHRKQLDDWIKRHV